MSGILTIECAEILGMTQTCDFWGDSINYRNVENYTTRARFKNRNDSTYALWSGISGLTPYITGDYFEVYAGNVNLGSGKITSFSSDGGQDVSRKFYNIGFQILKTGDLSFMTGFLDIGTTGYFPYLNSFSESFEYNQDNNKTVGFSRNIEIDFEKGFTNTFSGAVNIKNTVLADLENFGIYHPVQPDFYFSGEGIKRNGSRYDQINGKYSYSESYEYQSGVPYVWDYNHSLNYDTNGISNVTEGGKITATRRLQSGLKIDYANSGWNTVQTGIFGRVENFYNRWSGEIDSTCSLVDDPIEKSVTRNGFEGSVSYNYSYSNDPLNYSGYFWSYENQISLEQDGYAEVTENGSIRGKKYETGAIDGLISYFSGISAGVTGRVNEIYSSSSGFMKNYVCSSGHSGTLVETQNEKSYTPRPPQIDYNYSFSDDPSLFATGNFKKVKVSYVNNKPVHLVNFFNIVNSEELAQGSNQSTLGVLGTRVEIVGNTGVPISGYYARATGEVRIPSGVSFISDEQYSYDPFAMTFSFSRDYTYSNYRGINDYTV